MRKFITLLVVSLSLTSEVSANQPLFSSNYFEYCKPPGGFYVGGEYLFWKLDESGLNYATINLVEDQVGLGDLQQVDLQYSPGYRVWLGYHLPSSLWEVEGEYVYYSTKRRDKIRPDSDNVLEGTFLEFTLSNLVEAKSSFDFNFHNAKLQFARQFQPANNFKLRLVSGLQGAWLDQKWDVQYEGVLSTMTLNRNKWNYHAAGVHLGLNAEWCLTHGLGLVFGGTASALYGRHQMLTYMTALDSVIINSKQGDSRMAEALQFFAGFKWENTCKNVKVRLNVGYELSMWYNIQQRMQISATSKDSFPEFNTNVPIMTNTSLNMQGFVAGLSVLF